MNALTQPADAVTLDAVLRLSDTQLEKRVIPYLKLAGGGVP